MISYGSNKNKIDLIKEEGGKFCLLPNYFKVKNFSLKTFEIMNYLNINDTNNFFLYEKKMPKLKKKFNFFENNKILRRSGSFTPVNRIKKIEDIYPTVFNIEGHKNRKILEELETERKKKKKIGVLNSRIKKNNVILKKRMVKEKNKAEDENYKINLSDMAYKRQLLLSKVNLFKKDLNHLKRKISFKYHLELPSYNLFLNLNY